MIDVEKLNQKSYTNKVVKMYEELNTELVSDILKRIEKEGSIASFTKYQLRVLSRRGGAEIFKQTLKKINFLSERRKKELLNLFSEIINDDLSDYKELYKKRDLPFKLSKNQVKIFNEMVKLTDNELKNFTRTIAFSTQTEFVNALDKMYQQVVTGGIDFDTAFENTTKELAKKGINLKMKNGVTRSIEAAVRQNVLYGIRRTSQQINDDLIDYLGADAVQINISHNCRPSHRSINGKVFSLDKKNKKYPFFSKKYSDLLNDYGCQHYKSPFIIGVSEEIYTDEEIEQDNSAEVTFNGKKIPYYEATQKQRALERQIRDSKKMYLNMKTIENKNRIKNSEKNLLAFLKETGLYRDKQREFFAGYDD